MKMKEENIEEKQTERKSTNTAFYLMFPTVILTASAMYYPPSLGEKLIYLALAIYQFLMLKKFIEDYYQR